MKKHRPRKGDAKKRIAWTIIALVLVCALAFGLRGVIIYKLYPLEYQDEIKTASAAYGIDKHLVCAVICAESHFNVEAVSGDGAVGLMQIMPDTGAWAAGIIGIEGYTEDQLKDPQTNITIGCWYLSYLSEQLGQDAQKVLAAYNAGPAAVKDWIGEDGQISDIPYEETEKYVEKVQEYYGTYKNLYQDF